MSPINILDLSSVIAIALTSEPVKLLIIIVLFSFSIWDKKTEPSLKPAKIAFSSGNGSINVTCLFLNFKFSQNIIILHVKYAIIG